MGKRLHSIKGDKSMSIHDYDRLEHFRSDGPDWFVVNWCLGNTCNFACSYCPDALHDGSKKWHDIENVKMFVDKIKKYHPEKKIYFEFTGGEVTLYKDFIDICKFCKENEVRVGFITNGSRTMRWWKENIQYYDHVILSFHSEHADPEHFCKVVDFLKFEVRTHVNIMMNPDKWDLCLDVANRVKDIGNVSMAIQPLIHDLASELYDYTDEQHEVMNTQQEVFVRNISWTQEPKRNKIYRGSMKTVKGDGTWKAATPHSFIGNNTNNWKGWDCYAGVEQLIVDMDGSVWRGWCRVGGNIGYINDHDLVLPTTPINCNKNLCHCNFDIMSTKIRAEGSV